MPDPTYKTFLSPGSCQLEITDLVAAANDDTGIDLYGVAWEIEQVLIAGEGFAASPTDVWVNERGILNIGQSLFDKINRTAEDNDNVPGQCTVIVKATSLVDSSKVARLKVLVGYPSEGGGGGGGGVDTVELTIMEVLSGTMLSTAYFTVEDSSETQLTITPVTEGDFHWFTITANVGELLTFKPIDGSDYSFGSNTMYVMIESSEATYPLSFSTAQVKIVAANDPNAIDPYLMLELTDTQ